MCLVIDRRVARGVRTAARRFASGFTFERRRHPRTKMFFRAEDVFGFTRRMLRSMRDLSDIEETFRRELPHGSYGQNGD
jgi:predicted ATPase